ncbi:hypothetical protein C8R42DRAFT_550773, partial [Lentinula raphanica]
DNSDDWVWQWNDRAEKVIRQEANVHERWQRILSGKSNESYQPFNSRLEWEIAQWAVKEKISQSSFNRLLNIPDIKQKLSITFNNARSMLEKVDSIPERCGRWFTKQLSFKDRPGETFTIHHRDPIEAIKAILGDPSLASELVYKPGKLFRSSNIAEEERIFSEMWT